MQPKTLTFRAVGTALVPNYALQEIGTRAFVGRTLKLVDESQDQHGWVPSNEVAEVVCSSADQLAAYAQACKEGSLEPADEETARSCGLAFDAGQSETLIGDGTGDALPELDASVNPVIGGSLLRASDFKKKGS